MIVLFLLFALFIAYDIYSRIYNSRDHITGDPAFFKKDAKITNVKTKTVGLKGSQKFRTTVSFDDGFTYISHDTEVERRGVFYKMTLTNEMRSSIVRQAQREHDRLLKVDEPQNNDCNTNARIEPISSTDSSPTVETENLVEGSTWVCGKCRRRNLSSSHTCWNCGNSM